MTFPSSKTLLAATITVTAIGTAIGAIASSHREAPHITKYPQEDGTDFYMFNSYEDGREDFVTILANYNPIQAGFAGPNYFLLDNAALYEIHIDNDGDAVEDITFQIQMQNGVSDAGVVEFVIGEGDDQKNIPSILRNVAGIAIDQADGLSFEEKYTAAVVRGDRLEDPELFTDANANTVFEKPFDNAGTKTFSVDDYTDFADSFIQEVNIPGCDQQGRVRVVMGALCHDLPLGVAGDSADDGNGDGDGDEIVLNLAKTGAGGNSLDATGAVTNSSKRFRGFKGGRGKADDDVDKGDDIVVEEDGDAIEEVGAAVFVNLGLCEPADAPVGDQQLTDGAPVSAVDFDNTFPYLITPFPGSPIGAAIPTPKN